MLSSLDKNLIRSYQREDYESTSYKSVLLLCVLVVILFLFGFFTLDLNPPFDIVTMSRAMYVDEGFYSDAAQNYIKQGQWGLPYDMRHWPGAPMLTVLQTMSFSIFGMSIETARIISMLFAAISLFSVYGILRMKLPPFLAVCVAVIAVFTISFTAHSRAAIADPVATGFSMLALFCYVRLVNRKWAIVLSIFLSYCALLSKMYFLFAFITVVILWVFELIVLPILNKQHLVKKNCGLFIVTVCLVAASYLLFRQIFSEPFAQFHAINSNKTPTMNLLVLFDQLLFSLKHLPFNTKSHFFLGIICITFVFFLGQIIFSWKLQSSIKEFQNWGREGWALTIFLVLGLCTIGALNLPDKAHYHYFSILPIAALAIFSLSRMLPVKIIPYVVMLTLIIHLIFQVSYYQQWLSSSQNTSIEAANFEIVQMIEDSSSEKIIPVIGQYAAQLGLYSDRMMSLEVRWSSIDELCQRLDYWRPKLLTSFYYPMLGYPGKGLIKRCKITKGIELVKRFPIFDKWKDEILLFRINYKNE